MPGTREAQAPGATSTYRAVCVALTVAVCTGMLLLAAGLVPLALTRDVAPTVSWQPATWQPAPWQPAAPIAADQDRSPTR